MLSVLPLLAWLSSVSSVQSVSADNQINGIFINTLQKHMMKSIKTTRLTSELKISLQSAPCSLRYLAADITGTPLETSCHITLGGNIQGPPVGKRCQYVEENINCCEEEIEPNSV